jgi:hypothetical protein
MKAEISAAVAAEPRGLYEDMKEQQNSDDSRLESTLQLRRTAANPVAGSREENRSGGGMPPQTEASIEGQ